MGHCRALLQVYACFLMAGSFFACGARVLAHKPSEAEKFCLPAKDYINCLKYHRSQLVQLESQSSKGHQFGSTSVPEVMAKDSKEIKKSIPKSSTTVRVKSLKEGSKANPLDAIQSWYRPDHDIITFEPKVIYGPDGLDPNRYIRWTYSIYYFLSGFHEQKVLVKSPSHPGVLVERFGPVTWTVTADCTELTANWHGDRLPWSTLISERSSDAEALNVLKKFCPTVAQLHLIKKPLPEEAAHP